MKKCRIYQKYIKRLLDFAVSLVGAIILSPIIMIVAILVRIKLGSPVIFKQDRPGKNEKIFRLYKFRTMTDERDEKGELLPDKARLNQFGKMLRSTSLDELPELWNIIKGDMSLVGPRPLAVQYLPYYSEKEHHRHDVRPGLTGLAQINGRNAIDWEQKFAYDLQYVQAVGLFSDIKILFCTIKKVIAKENIGQGEEAPENFDVYRIRQREEKEI